VVNAGELRHPAKFVSPTVTTTGGDTTLDPRIESFESRVKVDPVGGLERRSEIKCRLRGSVW